MKNEPTLKLRQILWYYLPVAIMMIFTVVRLIAIFHHEKYIDFLCYMDIGLAVMKGIDPYVPANLVLNKWDDILIAFPAMSCFFIPAALLQQKCPGLPGGFFFLFNLLLLGSALVFIAGNTGLLQGINLKKPDSRLLLLFISAFLFINSSPVLTCLRHGQIGCVIMCGTLLILASANRYCQWAAFTLTTTLKFSMMPLFSIALFCKRKYLLCFIAFLSFTALCCLPALFGNNLFSLYERYVNVTAADTDNGFNCFRISGYNMLQFEFLRNTTLNSATKILIALFAIGVIFFKERKQPRFGLNLLLFLSCLNMLISYHRLYDMTLIMLLLSVKLNFFRRRNDNLNFAITGLFCFFYFIPFSVMLSAGNFIGHAIPAAGQFVYLTKYDHLTAIFPLPAIAMIALAIYATYIYFCTPDDYSFKIFKYECAPAKTELC